MSCENVRIATMACEFWAKYASIVTHPLLRLPWIEAIQPDLPVLVAALMHQMIYRSAHAAYLEKYPSRCTSHPGDDRSVEDRCEIGWRSVEDRSQIGDRLTKDRQEIGQRLVGNLETFSRRR